MDTLVLLGSFFVLMIVGVPVAYSLGLAALVGAWWIDLPLDAVMIQIASGVNKFSLLAIPFFVLAGAIMAEGGMSRRLVAFAGVLVGFIRGGLSLVNILASTFFGAISGSSVADTASIGSVLIPEMERKGYPRDFATAVTVSGSVQAILIPPSHNAVIYSLAAGGGVSIGALFMAGVLPGLLLGLTLAILCLFIAKRRNFPKGEVIPLKQALRIAADALWGLATMVIILGGILTGVFTATESASIAVLWAFFVTMFIYRDYRWSDLPKLVHRTVKTVTIVMILIGFAASFGYIMTLMQIPLKVTGFFAVALGQPLRDPAADQPAAAGAGHADGHGAADPDPDAHPAAAGDQAGRGPGALRHDHDGEPGHRPDHAAGGRGAVRRQRRRQAEDRGRGPRAVSLLRRHAAGAGAGDLHPRDLAVAAESDVQMKRSVL